MGDRASVSVAPMGLKRGGRKGGGGTDAYLPRVSPVATLCGTPLGCQEEELQWWVQSTHPMA